MKKGEASRFPFPLKPGAGDESRTRDLNLGKVALYQLSYSRIFDRTRTLSKREWSGRRVSNSRPQPWQGCALPTELLPPSSCEGFELYTVFRDWQELSSKKAEKYHKHGTQRSFFRRFQAFSGDSRRKSAFSSSVLRSPTQPSPVATVRSASSRLRSSMSLMRSSKVPAQRKR